MRVRWPAMQGLRPAMQGLRPATRERRPAIQGRAALAPRMAARTTREAATCLVILDPGSAATPPVVGIDASGRPEAEGAGLGGVSEGDGALATALQSAGAALGMLQGGSREDGLASQALEPSDGSAGARGAGGAGAGWVIIHGGPDRSWQRESTVSKMGAAMPAPEAGDPRDGDLAPAGSAALRDGDSAAWAPAVFDWEEICRPWQPDTGTASVCPISALPLPAAGDP